MLRSVPWSVFEYLGIRVPLSLSLSLSCITVKENVKHTTAFEYGKKLSFADSLHFAMSSLFSREEGF